MHKKIKQFRQSKQETQRSIAEKIGIDQRQWSRYESGINEIPLRYIIKLCEIYETTPNEILGFETV